MSINPSNILVLVDLSDMAYECVECSRFFSTPYNLSRHRATKHREMRDYESQADSESTVEEGEIDEATEPDSDGDMEVEEEEDTATDNEAWRFLFRCILHKDPDYLLTADKLRNELIEAGVSRAVAKDRGTALYLKLLSAELRDTTCNVIGNVRLLRRDPIYKKIMEDVVESDQPFYDAFREAWRKHKHRQRRPKNAYVRSRRTRKPDSQWMKYKGCFHICSF